MQPLPIIEHLDVVEHRRFGLRAGAEAAVINMLDLERGKDALHRRVVQAIAASAHGLNDAVPRQHRPIGLGGILHPPVAMVGQTG